MIGSPRPPENVGFHSIPCVMELLTKTFWRHPEIVAFGIDCPAGVIDLAIDFPAIPPPQPLAVKVSFLLFTAAADRQQI